MPRKLAYDVLTLVEEGDMLARDAFAGLPSAQKLAPRDRGLAQELVQGVLRRCATLDVILALRLKRGIDQQDPRVLRVLRIGAYQILFLDRIPAAAAVSSAVDLVRTVRREGTAPLVNAVLRAVAGLVAGVQPDEGDPRRSIPRGDGTYVRLTEDAFADPSADLAGSLAGRYSVPRFAVERFLAQHGADGARSILEASIARPPVSVRPRLGREAEVAAAFTAAGVAFEPEGVCLLVRGVGDVRKLPLWDAGAFVIQDATAADAALAFAPADGLHVLDVCAAPGGKTLVLSEAVGPTGSVVALDVPGTRLLQLMETLALRGMGNVEVYGADATDAAALPRGPKPESTDAFDAVLVDAPCSNTGVLAKRVEVRGRLTDGSALASLAGVQERLLEAAATRVKPGGRLAWSTCSIDDQENGTRVRAFLAAHPEFALVSERLTLPVPGRRDGGYVAMLRRVG